MFVIQLLLAWGMLYLAWRFIFGTGKPNKGTTSGESKLEPPSQPESGYFNDPDIFRPEIDDLDPTDFM